MKADPLAYVCPSCKAQPGQRCRNYRGKGCAPHRTRGPDQGQARFAARAARKAARINAARDAAAPLSAAWQAPCTEAQLTALLATPEPHQPDDQGARAAPDRAFRGRD